MTGGAASVQSPGVLAEIVVATIPDDGRVRVRQAPDVRFRPLFADFVRQFFR